MSKQTHTEFMIVLFLQDIPKMLHLLENHDIDSKPTSKKMTSYNIYLSTCHLSSTSK